MEISRSAWVTQALDVLRLDDVVASLKEIKKAIDSPNIRLTESDGAKIERAIQSSLLLISNLLAKIPLSDWTEKDYQDACANARMQIVSYLKIVHIQLASPQKDQNATPLSEDRKMQITALLGLAMLSTAEPLNYANNIKQVIPGLPTEKIGDSQKPLMNEPLNEKFKTFKNQYAVYREAYTKSSTISAALLTEKKFIMGFNGALCPSSFKKMAPDQEDFAQLTYGQRLETIEKINKALSNPWYRLLSFFDSKVQATLEQFKNKKNEYVNLVRSEEGMYAAIIQIMGTIYHPNTGGMSRAQIQAVLTDFFPSQALQQMVSPEHIGDVKFPHLQASLVRDLSKEAPQHRVSITKGE